MDLKLKNREAKITKDLLYRVRPRSQTELGLLLVQSGTL